MNIKEALKDLLEGNSLSDAIEDLLEASEKNLNNYDLIKLDEIASRLYLHAGKDHVFPADVKNFIKSYHYFGLEQAESLILRFFLHAVTQMKQKTGTFDFKMTLAAFIKMNKNTVSDAGGLEAFTSKHGKVPKAPSTKMYARGVAVVIRKTHRYLSKHASSN